MNEQKVLKQPNIPEHIIDIPGTVFEILIKAHKLSHVKDNIYKNKDGRKFHLTIYGLEPVELFSMNELIKELEAEKKKTANQLNELNSLYTKLKKN